MNVSRIQAANLALGLLGERTISDFNDGSTEADVITLQFDPARRDFLERRRWVRATDRAVLTPLAENPAFGYTNAFQIPPDCLAVRDIYDESYKRILDRTIEGKKILANADTLNLKYTKDLAVDQFSGAMVKGFTALLAAEIAIPLGEEQLAPMLYQKAQREISRAFTVDARKNHSNENSDILRQGNFHNDTLRSRGRDIGGGSTW